MAAPSFPLTMPTSVFSSLTQFRIVPITTRTKLRSGATFGRNIGQAGWQIKIITSPQKDVADHGKWQSFFDSLRGGVKSCLLYNPRRRVPVTYRATDMQGLTKAGGGAFNGTANLVDRVSEREIDISGLPAGFVLKRGDLVGLVKDSRYYLGRCQSDETANGSGEVTLFVEPPVPESFTATTNGAQFREPKIEATVDLDSITGDEDAVTPRPVTFVAQSRLF